MKTILIIDDDEDSNLILSSLLEDTYTVVTFLSWKESEEFLRKNFPNLILVDISMPDMDGYEVIKHIRSNSHLNNIPLVAITAYALGKDSEKLLRHGFVDCLSKPINENRLLRLIDNRIR